MYTHVNIILRKMKHIRAHHYFNAEHYSHQLKHWTLIHKINQTNIYRLLFLDLEIQDLSLLMEVRMQQSRICSSSSLCVDSQIS